MKQPHIGPPKERPLDRHAPGRAAAVLLAAAAFFVVTGLLVDSPRLGFVIGLLMVLVAAMVAGTARLRALGRPLAEGARRKRSGAR